MRIATFVLAGMCFMMAFYAAIAKYVGSDTVELIFTRVSCLFGIVIFPMLLMDKYVKHLVKVYKASAPDVTISPEAPVAVKIRDGKMVADYGECEICKLPIGTSFVGTGGGKAHLYCYHKHEMPENHLVFERVLGCKDQYLLRQMLVDYVPDEIKIAVMRAYNERAKELWERRQKSYREEYEKLVMMLTEKEVQDAKVST